MRHNAKHELATDEEKAVFGRNVKKARHARKLNQRDTAKAAGLTQGWLSAVELGRANVTLETMGRLAKLFRTTIRELLDGEG